MHHLHLPVDHMSIIVSHPVSLQEVDAQEKHIKVLQEQKHASKEMQQVVQKLPDVFDHVMCALETGSASGAVPVPIDTVSRCSF